MSQDHRGRSGSVDPNLAQRVEALVDEAVGQAAKGSYGEAAARAEQALAIDPDNAAARDLFDSYRRLAADDDERRRRRRSIAAAAAAIEEMIEAERLEEAATATQALVLQYGHEAPVEELNGRIAKARGGDLDFAELDAAIQAIRQPTVAVARSAGPAARLDEVGTLTAEIEDHLRSGRLDEASGRLGKLEGMPGSEERLRKLRARIEEAHHVAEDHRREEEILIATAAIEERIRRGAIDDAAERLAALDARHGSSAPIAELRQQIEEARSEAAIETGAVRSAVGERTGELLGLDDDLGSTTVDLSAYEAPAPGRGRWLAVAVAVVLVAGGGGWWLYQRPSTGAIEASPAGDPVAIVDPSGAPATAGALDPAPADPAQTDGAIAESGALDPEGSAAEQESSALLDSPPTAVDAGMPGSADAPLAAGGDGQVDQSARASEASPAGADPSTPINEPPSEEAPAVAARDAQDSVEPADSSGSRDPDATAASDVAVTPAETSSPSSSDLAPEPGEPAASSAVVVQAVPVTEALPPPAPTAPAPAVSESTAADQPAPTGDADRAEPEAPAAEGQRAAVADEGAPAASSAAPATSSRPAAPAVLGCGAPGVVCVKALQMPIPTYPAPARARRLTANVVVMALVDDRGRVIETRVESGSFRFFNDAAVEAASRAVFQPATLRGVPGRSWVRLTFKFDPS
jgi:TonB family protein